MDCVRLGARNFTAMTVSFCPTVRRGVIPSSKKEAPIFRYGTLCNKHSLLQVRANAGSESCVGVGVGVAVKQGFADEEDYVKGGGSELLFVQMQQNKTMEKQSKLADKVNSRLCCFV